MDILSLLLGNRLTKNLAGKKGYTSDILDLLGAIGKVGRPADPAFPSEMFPLGAQLYGRGMYTLLAVQPNPDWIWPFFIERQFNPYHKDFVGRGHSIMVLNTTHRNWTAVGVIGSDREAVVDSRGLVTPRYNGWSADVWLLEGDKLFAPSKLDAVSQKNIGKIPAVRTAFAAAGQEVQSDVFAVMVAGKEAVLQKVTVRNTSSAAKNSTLCFSLRPYNPEGLSVVKEVTADEKRIAADRGTAIVLMSKPDAVDCSNEEDGDVALTLGGGMNRRSAKCRVGLANAVAEYNVSLAPGEEKSFWFVMPMKLRDDAGAWAAEAAKIDPEAAFEKTKREWRERLAGTMQIEIPDENLQTAFDINKAYLLLLWDGDAITPGPFTYHHFWFRDAAYQVTALEKMGFRSEAERVLATYPGRQRADGFFISQNGEWDANGQAMWTLLEHYKYTRDKKFLETIWPSLEKGVKWIQQKRMATTRDKSSPVYGLMPAGLSAEHFGPNDYYYWDDYWCLAGVRAAEEAALELGKDAERRQFHQEHDRYFGHIEASLAWVERKLGRRLLPASPYRRMNSGAIGAAAVLYPLRIYPPDDERMANTIGEIRRLSFFEDGFFQNNYHSGVNAYLTLQIAQCLLQRRDPDTWKLLRYIMSLASPTYTWPEAVHPQTRGGVMGDGHHGWAVADLLHIIRNLLLVEEGETLVVFPLLPAEWFDKGKSITVKEAPTHFGKVGLSMKSLDTGAVLEIDAAWHHTPERVVVRFPKKIATAKIDGKEETLQLTDSVELGPDAKRLEVVFA